ncbi:hypothetical protein X743_32035 [Mesorhizobium sp. LNHC252B00]|nr:hypothetical protein X743_32035 [Mesorhizobium sp. LNHC252B00]
MVEFHYRWHPYYGGRFRHEGREDRANGWIIRVEFRPGEIIQVVEWMLDRAFCADMEMGEPRVAVIGLMELDGLLAERGFRQTSTDGLMAIQEARHEGFATTALDITGADPAAEYAARYAADARPERRGPKRRCWQVGDPPDGRGRRRDEGDER